jgi:putative hydrolase of the HAD superfamily
MDLRWYELSYWFDRFDLPGSHETILDSYSHAIHIYDDVVPVLEELEESYRLIVISNAHRDFLNRTLQSISHYFDHVFSATSDYEQVGKSHYFYRRICRALIVSPREMAHVGDHFEFDYEAPRQVGIQAFFLDRHRVHHQDGLQSLTEFKEKISDLENHGE